MKFQFGSNFPLRSIHEYVSKNENPIEYRDSILSAAMSTEQACDKSWGWTLPCIINTAITFK
jgi:hypothetical protein